MATNAIEDAWRAWLSDPSGGGTGFDAYEAGYRAAIERAAEVAVAVGDGIRENAAGVSKFDEVEARARMLAADVYAGMVAVEIRALTAGTGDGT